MEIKGSHSVSILQGREKICFITNSNLNLEKHHIYFGGKRDISDKYGFWVWLTPELHRGTNGVHGKNGHDIDLFLKKTCQEAYERKHSRQEFMDKIGKNYLEV